MRIAILHCDEETALHIWSRHRVTSQEASEAAYGHGLIIRGRAEGLYEVFGRTEAGRYLTIIVRNLGDGLAQLITARDMGRTERRRYERYTAH
jgi:hypothetical protein